MKKHLVKAFLAMVMLGVGLFATPAVMAIDPFCNDNKDLMGSVAWEAAGCDETATDQVGSSVSNIIKIAIGALGLVAVVVIIIGGVYYMTAAGDSSKLKRAKDTIFYAAIGLIIAALSFAITDFVIALLK